MYLFKFLLIFLVIPNISSNKILENVDEDYRISMYGNVLQNIFHNALGPKQLTLMISTNYKVLSQLHVLSVALNRALHKEGTAMPIILDHNVYKDLNSYVNVKFYIATKDLDIR